MSKVVGKVGEDLRRHYGQTEESYQAFACGFAAGQAEKVYLGVCKAAMFRPSNEHFKWYLSEVKRIAEAYELEVVILSSFQEETAFEIWICRDKGDVGSWMFESVNSPDWHKLRAEACGISWNRVDVNYHLRKGYGERCD